MSKKNPKNEFEVWVEEVRSGKYPHLYIEPDTGLIGLSEEMTAKFKELLNRDLFESSPYLREEGLFDITIKDKKLLRQNEGMMLVFTINKDNNNSSELVETSGTSPQYYKAGFFYDGFGKDFDLEFILHRLTIGAQATIRISKNYKGTQYYIRYISQGEYAVGYRKEPNEKEKNL